MTGEEIRRQREARGLSQDDLAREIGTTQQTVQRIEKDITKHSLYKELIVDFLKGNDTAKADWYVNLEARNMKEKNNRRRGVAAEHPRKYDFNEYNGESSIQVGFMPVFSTKIREDAYLSIGKNVVIYIARPAPLLGVEGSYGIYVADNTMNPFIKQGEIALLHPNLPPVIGEEHFYVSSHIDESESVGIIGKLVDYSNFHLEIEQYNPLKQHELGIGSLWEYHRVVGKFSRL